MIRIYTLDDDSEFKTLTIPKGTLLFHGMQLESQNPIHLFSHFIGKHSKEKGGYHISPTTNIFFYPVPYVSSSVDYFNVNIIYTTNYDVELLLMIRPSEMARKNRYNSENGIKLIRTCSEISEKDKCGFQMSKDDPCFTAYCMEHFPNIAGYISIAITDYKRFIYQYSQIYKKYQSFEKLIQILPSLVSDSRDIISIPEIVLHPLHIRQSNCIDFVVKGVEDDPSYLVNYCIRHRRRFNYFPLLYVNQNGSYHINDLKNYKLYKNFGNEITPIEDFFYNPYIFKKLEFIIKNLLSPKGGKIHGINYRISIDLRTGFYILNQNIRTEEVNIVDMKGYNKNKNILLEYQTWDETRNDFKNNIIPFQFPLKDKYMIMSLLGHTSDTLENYELRLGNYGMTLTNKYVLDKGKNGKKYKNIFHIENILERMDISPTNIWKNKNTKTRKRNKQENSL